MTPVLVSQQYSLFVTTLKQENDIVLYFDEMVLKCIWYSVLVSSGLLRLNCCFHFKKINLETLLSLNIQQLLIKTLSSNNFFFHIC